MPFPLDYTVSALVTLLVVVDPVGLAPIFLAVTAGLPRRSRRQVAVRATLIAAAILMGTAVIGDWLLGTLGISLPAFRIAGGLLLLWIATEMVFGSRAERKSKNVEGAAEEHVHHVAAFPLAIPLMAGPGAITATVLLAGQAGSEPMRHAVLIGVILLVCLACFIVFAIAARIAGWMGITGNVVLSRLLGVLLAALAVQFVIDGVKTAIG